MKLISVNPIHVKFLWRVWPCTLWYWQSSKMSETIHSMGGWRHIWTKFRKYFSSI